MNSRSFQIFIALSIPIIVIISVLLLISFEKKTVSSVVGDFPYELWSNSPKSCIGNTYNATIEINSQLALLQDRDEEGVVFDNGIVVLATFNAMPLPVFIPSGLGISVYPKQKFNAHLYINKNGSVQAKALNKF